MLWLLNFMKGRMAQMDAEKHIWIGDNETIKWEHDDKLYCLHIMRDDDASNPREDDGGLLTTMACWHRDYRLGDLAKGVSAEDWWRSLVSKNVPYDELMKALLSGELSIKAAEIPGCPGRYDELIKGGDGDWGWCHEDLSYGSLKDFMLPDLEIKDCMKLMKDYAVWLPLWLYDHSGISMSCGERVYPYNDRWDSGQVGWILMTKLNALTIYDADKRGWQKAAIETMRHEVEVYSEWLEGLCYGYKLYEADKPKTEKSLIGAKKKWTPAGASTAQTFSQMICRGPSALGWKTLSRLAIMKLVLPKGMLSHITHFNGGRLK